MRTRSAFPASTTTLRRPAPSGPRPRARGAPRCRATPAPPATHRGRRPVARARRRPARAEVSGSNGIGLPRMQRRVMVHRRHDVDAPHHALHVRPTGSANLRVSLHTMPRRGQNADAGCTSTSGTPSATHTSNASSPSSTHVCQPSGVRAHAACTGASPAASRNAITSSWHSPRFAAACRCRVCADTPIAPLRHSEYQVGQRAIRLRAQQAHVAALDAGVAGHGDGCPRRFPLQRRHPSAPDPCDEYRCRGAAFAPPAQGHRDHAQHLYAHVLPDMQTNAAGLLAALLHGDRAAKH
jgi:hypothetical protein